MKRLFLAGLVLAAVCLPAQRASAQTGTARGKVVDEKGQGVVEAKITIEYLGPMARKYETKTNKKGEFTQVGIQPGNYRITANKDGYQASYIEHKISLGDPTYLPELKLVTQSAAQAAATDKGMAELKGAFESANALLQAGKLDEAEAAFKALVQAHPEIPQLHHNLAIVYTQKKDVAGAEAAYLKAIEAKADYVEGYAGLSTLYLANEQGAKAVDLMTKAVAAQPQSAKLQFQLGFALFNTGQYEPAEAAFKKAESLDATDAEVHYYLGTIALTTGRKPECVTQLEKYLAMSPQNKQNAAVAPGLLQACKQ